jgi:hypothetical protein
MRERLQFWKEMLAEQCAEHGIEVTAAQVDALALDVCDCAETAGDYFGGPAAAGPYRGPTEAERLKKELEKERSKVTCRVCNGTGSDVQHFGPIGRISVSQCSRCSGHGRHAP